ncbi:MAG: hypothetical protein QOF52_2573 [Propionibacteriaceae bacterium]|jgi:uncharacterized membrane protein YhaH (DUF805 family)|nr:hypothetical protein [Propionibacteriaceae bacterium]MDX6322715.1 hypothetical protein [Propionibacteriaceae bacterium]
MSNKNLRLALGGLTGVVGLIGMLRLADGAFNGPLSTFSWIFVLLAMIPWIGYAAYRARHGRLSRTWMLVVAGLCVVGLITVWIFTIGAVVALLCSLLGFAVIWVHDWPPRRPRSDDRFVRIEDLTADESD